MGWSIHLGRIFGIAFRIHWTFFLLIIWIVAARMLAGAGVVSAIGSGAFVLAIFGCVVLHELGHALAARAYGIRTRDITLLPLGGVARLERIPEEPARELVVAIAGPLVNVVIAGALVGGLAISGRLDELSGAPLTGDRVIADLASVNIALVVFNMIPAFPMDGGRVLRALLATRLDYVRATRAAAGVGQVVAVLFGIAGIFLNPLLILIAVFVFVGAGAEARAAAQRHALDRLAVRDAMVTRFRSLQSTDSLADASDALLEGSQHDFPVREGGRVVGLLGREEIVRGIASLGREARVDQAMRRDVPVFDEQEDLARAFQRMQESGSPAGIVESKGEATGLLTSENIAELIMLREADMAAHGPAPRRP